MRGTKRWIGLLVAIVMTLGLLPALAADATPYYKTLDPNVNGSLDIMVWSGDSIYHEDLGKKDWKPEDITSQNVAAVYAMAKAFNAMYPNVKVNLWAKIDDPHGNNTSWQQEMENFKAEHGKYPDIYASTDLVGDVTKGLVADLSAFQNDPLYQTFNPAIMNMMNYYGFQGGLPQFMQPWGVWVNKELAENNNIDVPDPDWDIDDYTAIATAGDNKTFWGAMDTPLSFIMTGSDDMAYSMSHYKGEGDRVNLASEQVANLLAYLPQWAASAVWPQNGLGNVPTEIMDDGWWWGFRFFCRNYVLTLDGDPWMLAAATGGKDEAGNWVVNAVESADWDIYPRPATPYRGNTVGLVIDPMAVHNYAMDDNNPAWSEEELAKFSLAYAFSSFWAGSTEAMQARADQQFSNAGALRSALNDSFPLVTGDAFQTQMDIWYATPSHQRYADKDKMPGFQYVLELWEKGEMWDISDKTYPFYVQVDGTQTANLYEWLNIANAEVAGAGTTDANWLDTVKSKLADWNRNVNNRFVQAETELKNGLTRYYGFTDADF